LESAFILLQNLSRELLVDIGTISISVILQKMSIGTTNTLRSILKKVSYKFMLLLIQNWSILMCSRVYSLWYVDLFLETKSFLFLTYERELTGWLFSKNYILRLHICSKIIIVGYSKTIRTWQDHMNAFVYMRYEKCSTTWNKHFRTDAKYGIYKRNGCIL